MDWKGWWCLDYRDAMSVSYPGDHYPYLQVGGLRSASTPRGRQAWLFVGDA